MQRQLRRVIQAQTEMGDKHEAGMVSHRIAEQEFTGEFGSMVRASNTLVSSHIAVTMQIVALTERYAAGDLSQQLAPLPGEKAVISQSINDVRASLLSINNEIRRLASTASAPVDRPERLPTRATPLFARTADQGFSFWAHAIATVKRFGDPAVLPGEPPPSHRGVPLRCRQGQPKLTYFLTFTSVVI